MDSGGPVSPTSPGVKGPSRAPAQRPGSEAGIRSFPLSCDAAASLDFAQRIYPNNLSLLKPICILNSVKSSELLDQSRKHLLGHCATALFRRRTAQQSQPLQWGWTSRQLSPPHRSPHQGGPRPRAASQLLFSARGCVPASGGPAGRPRAGARKQGAPGRPTRERRSDSVITENGRSQWRPLRFQRLVSVRDPVTPRTFPCSSETRLTTLILGDKMVT